jgi:hypothetical protein
MSQLRAWGPTVSDAITTALAGGVPTKFVVHKFGKNPTAAAGDAIWSTGGAYPYLTYTGTALAMRAAAGGDAADDDGSTGARTVTIQGLDGNFEIASETITLNGASASAATTTTFSRVLRVFVATTGSGRVNAADIVIEDSGGAATYATIPAGKSQSEIGFLTVPAGYRAFLTQLVMSTDVASGTATVQIEGWARDAEAVAAPFGAARRWFDELALSRENGAIERSFAQPIEFDEYSDVWFEATPSTGTPAAACRFTMLFEKK